MKGTRSALVSLMVTFVLVLPVGSASSLESPPSQDQLEKAAEYLIAMYNPTLGLIANSEDEGPNPVSDGVPCFNTYWVYSDNLFAGWALQPFNKSIADNITSTVERYADRHGWSMLFEVVIGQPIPTTVHANKNIVVFDAVVDGERVQVVLDRHHCEDNPGIFYDAEEYADLCFYMTINYWMMGDTSACLHWFRTGEAMWNTSTKKGFYDKATRADGRYQNYKLGLFLLAQRTTEFRSTITKDVEATAWSYQKDNGGIVTQSWPDGSPYGTANAEATAALLLAYNENLTGRLHRRETIAESELKEAYKTIEQLNSTVISQEKRIADLNNQINDLEDWLETVETELARAIQTIDDLNGQIADLTWQPWKVDPWPIWFSVLLVLTVILATTTSAMAVKLKRPD